MDATTSMPTTIGQRASQLQAAYDAAYETSSSHYGAAAAPTAGAAPATAPGAAGVDVDAWLSNSHAPAAVASAWERERPVPSPLDAQGTIAAAQSVVEAMSELQYTLERKKQALADADANSAYYGDDGADEAAARPPVSPVKAPLTGVPVEYLHHESQGGGAVDVKALQIEASIAERHTQMALAAAHFNFEECLTLRDEVERLEEALSARPHDFEVEQLDALEAQVVDKEAEAAVLQGTRARQQRATRLQSDVRIVEGMLEQATAAEAWERCIQYRETVKALEPLVRAAANAADSESAWHLLELGGLARMEQLLSALLRPVLDSLPPSPQPPRTALVVADRVRLPAPRATPAPLASVDFADSLEQVQQKVSAFAELSKSAEWQTRRDAVHMNLIDFAASNDASMSERMRQRIAEPRVGGDSADAAVARRTSGMSTSTVAISRSVDGMSTQTVR